MTKSLTRHDCREIDRRAMAEFGVSGLVLMEHAGRGAAELFMKLNPDKFDAVIICGSGNNGGDGLVMANYLNQNGWHAYVILVDDPKKLSFYSMKFYYDYISDWHVANEVEYFTESFYVDALLGTGLSRPITGRYAEIINALNSYGRPILALDIPSGLDCDTGEPLGLAVKATHTATFVGRKKGFDNPVSLHYTGEVHVIDIGAPRILVDQYIK